MKIENICYLAGLFDADGCATNHIAKKKDSNKTVKVHSCEIAMTNKEVIYWVKDTLGFGNIHYKKKEIALRKHYKKLMLLANKVTEQKAQLEEAKRQFEDKLQAASGCRTMACLLNFWASSND